MKKRFGQHFLFDPNILKKILKCSKLHPDDSVVEIGPGPGTLTKLLSEHAKNVIAIEIDKRLFDKLKKTFTTIKNVELIRADALKFPYDSIKDRFKVVANIPYYITTPLLFRLLEYKDKIPSMTLLLQKEVARRITAVPGNKEYGVLSISMQLHTKPTFEFAVSRKAFSPPPEIDSAVVHFEILSQPVIKENDQAFFLKVVKTAFTQRRKTILNSLKSFNGIREALRKADIDPQLRPENLSIKDFVKLTEVLK